MKIKQLKMLILLAFCLMAPVMTAAAQNNVPDWAVGTFTARNPQTGGVITMTVYDNGNVTVNLDGTENYGSFNNRILTLNNIASRVKRTSDGFSTTRIDNGERIDYYRGDGGGSGGNVPDWAVGTFTARNPQTGGVITLTINGNGAVTANLDGSVNNGSYNNGRITINGVTSNVRRDGNGIRTTRVDNGERIDYVRGYNGGGGSADRGDVPNWAIGNFYTRNPQTGETIGLSITSDGNVTVNFAGTTEYGTMYKDRLTLNGVTSRVKKNGRGIRTTRLDNGERIDYNRQR